MLGVTRSGFVVGEQGRRLALAQREGAEAAGRG